MRSKRDIKMGRLCTQGGVKFRFLNTDAIPDKKHAIFRTFIALVVLLKTIPNFRL